MNRFFQIAQLFGPKRMGRWLLEVTSWAITHDSRCTTTIPISLPQAARPIFQAPRSNIINTRSITPTPTILHHQLSNYHATSSTNLMIYEPPATYRHPSIHTNTHSSCLCLLVSFFMIPETLILLRIRRSRANDTLWRDQCPCHDLF